LRRNSARAGGSSGAFRRSFDAHGDHRDAKIEAAGGRRDDPGFASVSARACLLFARDLCVSDKNTYKVVAGISRTPRLRDKATFPEQLAAP
jgi:hypothetical protein